MPLSSITLGSLIDTNLINKRAVGSNRTIFSNAIAKGIVNSIVGSTFTTSDTGTGTGGTGTGTGITGLNSTVMINNALSTMISTGTNAQPMMDAIMNAVITHLGSATLTTVNPAVGNGTGTVNIGTFSTNILNMKTNIQTELENIGAVGVNRSNLSLSIATGIVNELLASGTGTVTISGGVGGGSTSGTGTGTVS